MRKPPVHVNVLFSFQGGEWRGDARVREITGLKLKSETKTRFSAMVPSRSIWANAIRPTGVPTGGIRVLAAGLREPIGLGWAGGDSGVGGSVRDPLRDICEAIVSKPATNTPFNSFSHWLGVAPAKQACDRSVLQPHRNIMMAAPRSQRRARAPDR
jgi:hypothetical protein